MTDFSQFDSLISLMTYFNSNEAGGHADSLKYDPDYSWYDEEADKRIKWGTEFPEYKHVAKFGHGMKVAKQRANGTGKYVKGKGWQ